MSTFLKNKNSTHGNQDVDSFDTSGINLDANDDVHSQIELINQ